jgi:pimeloyl-ACP methyl ester carboxylesterase
VVPDTRAVLDALGIERCLVGGWSGGGPHALACGARLEGVAAVLVIAGVAPYEADGLDWMAGMGDENVVEFGASVAGESILRTYLEGEREQLKAVTGENIMIGLETVLPTVDKAALTEEFAEDMATSFREALRIGVEGWLDDDLAFSTSWQFALAEVNRPTSLWQGSVDLMVPYAHGQWLAAQLPNVTPHLLEGEGHLSIVRNSIGSMFDEVIDAAHSTE